jgi:hypothetical protein
MSVRPVQFQPNGDIDVVFDELGHSGTIPAAEVQWATKIDGSHDHNFLVLNCPDGCGATSTHPVGGGAAPAEVQQMFVEKTQREGCACGNVEADRTDSVPESHVRLQSSRMDGPERWHEDTSVELLKDPDEEEGKVKIVYHDDTRLIVGEKSKGGVGSDHKLAHISFEEYEKLLNTAPAYLSADREHVLSAPP